MQEDLSKSLVNYIINSKWVPKTIRYYITVWVLLCHSPYVLLQLSVPKHTSDYLS